VLGQSLVHSKCKKVVFNGFLNFKFSNNCLPLYFQIIFDRLLTIIDPYDIPDVSPLRLDDQPINPPPTIDDQQQNQVIIDQVNPEIVQIPNVDAEQSQNMDENGDNTDNSQDSMSERADSFRNAVEAFKDGHERAGQVIRRRHRLPNRQRQPQVEDGSLKMLKLRKKRKYKTKRRAVRPMKLPPVDDFFSDIEVYMLNDLPFEDEEAEVSN